MNKNKITFFVLSALLVFGMAFPAIAATSTTNPKASTKASCVKAAIAKEKVAFKAAKALTSISARKAATKATQQQCALDRKACK